MNVILYSTPTCPKCKILGKKLDAKNIPYIKEMNEQILSAKGLSFVPWLEVDGQMMDFNTANKWINEQ